MAIEYLDEGIIAFKTDGRAIDSGKLGYNPIYRIFHGEVPLDIDFDDGSGMSFRFGLDVQRFTFKPEFYFGNDGTKEVFLQPAHEDYAKDYEGQGFEVKDASRYVDSDFGRRLKQSFIGHPLESIVFLQNPEDNIDSVILQNANGQFRSLNEHGYLIAIEEIPADENEKKTIYEVGEKGSHYRIPNLMVAAALAQENDIDSPIEGIVRALLQNLNIPFKPVSIEDLNFEESNDGNIVHLGCKIK